MLRPYLHTKQLFFIIVCGAGLHCNPACASSAGYGYITAVLPMSTGAVLFNTSGTRNASPSCQSPSVPARYALDGSTVAGQAQIAILLNAYNLYKRITIVGQNACSIWGDTETVAYFQLED